MNDLREYLLLLCLCLGGCTSMAWEVNSNTTEASLNVRYKIETSQLDQDDICVVGDPLREGFGNSECERQYHEIWRSYWAARRELAAQRGQ